MIYDWQFPNALKYIFIGSKVDEKSGTINLIQLKAGYLANDVFPQLMKDIDAVCKLFEDGLG
jgi:hypothetical protein